MTTADEDFVGPGLDRAASLLAALADRLRRVVDGVRDLGEGNDDAGPRLRFLILVFAAAFVVLALGAARAALLTGQPARRLAPPPTRLGRADLLDRNDEVLATDVIRYGLYVRPAEIEDRPATAAALGAILPPSVKAQKIASALEGHSEALTVPPAAAKPFDPVALVLGAVRGQPRTAARAPNPDQEYFVAGDLTPDIKDRLHDLALPGLDFPEEAGRLYPLGETAAHLIGFASKDGKGLAGAEEAFDSEARRKGAEPVHLSIDLRIQAALQDEVGAAAQHFGVKDAAGLVVNVRTGEILAMESYPGFDPNAEAILIGDERKRLINHAASSVYEPGSVFKIFTLAMVLDSGVAGLDTPVNVHSPLILPGQIIHDFDKADSKLGQMPLWEVFTHSSNIGAAQLALEAGSSRVERYFGDFGLFDRAPSELAESARPLVQKPPLSRNTVATYGFGHAISVSPLALATGMSAILNGGAYRPLTLLRQDPGRLPPPTRTVIRPATSEQMLGLMRLNATKGTGRAADALAPGYRVGGKTGTATKLVNGHYSKGNPNLASFAAVFPTDGPLESDRYLVLIMMDEPQRLPETHGFTTGGVISAPIAGRVIARIAPLLGVRRDPAAAAAGVPATLDAVALSGGER
jgi:cell division protein FtsI (penicillin-binding protein 3)